MQKNLDPTSLIHPVQRVLDSMKCGKEGIYAASMGPIKALGMLNLKEDKELTKEFYRRLEKLNESIR